VLPKFLSDLRAREMVQSELSDLDRRGAWIDDFQERFVESRKERQTAVSATLFFAPGWPARSRRELQFRQASLDGLAIALEKSSDVSDAAVAKFESLIGSVEAPLTFIERRVGEKHRLFDTEEYG